MFKIGDEVEVTVDNTDSYIRTGAYGTVVGIKNFGEMLQVHFKMNSDGWKFIPMDFPDTEDQFGNIYIIPTRRFKLKSIDWKKRINNARAKL